MKLEQEVQRLESMLAHADVKNEKISARGVDWHIDHCLRILDQVYDALAASNPTEYKWKFNALRTIIFLKGSFPRGKARAPKAVNNKQEIIVHDLELLLAIVKDKVDKIYTLPEGSYFMHPYFGEIKRDKTISFLIMHTHHHYKIIQDILNK